MENCTGLESFAKLRQSFHDNTTKGIAFTLLEDLMSIVPTYFLLLKIKFRISKSEIANQMKISHNKLETIYIIYPLKIFKITVKKVF